MHSPRSLPALSTRPLPIAGPYALDAGMLTREDSHILLDMVSTPSPSAPKPSAPKPSPDSGRFDCAGLVFFIWAAMLAGLQMPFERSPVHLQPLIVGQFVLFLNEAHRVVRVLSRARIWVESWHPVAL